MAEQLPDGLDAELVGEHPVGGAAAPPPPLGRFVLRSADFRRATRLEADFWQMGLTRSL